MRRLSWKGFVLAGLLGMTGLATGCTERDKADVREELREAGQGIGEAAKDVENAGRDTADGVREGYGGSGTDKQIGDGKIGEQEGVINDGEGPFEQNGQRGEDNPIKDSEGPLEENH
jgi:hypothetical protein